MYYAPSPSSPSPKAITLSPRAGCRRLLAFCLWFLGVWFVTFGSAWIVDAIITGEEVWRTGPALLILIATALVIGRTMSLETIYVGNVEIRRVGIFKEHSMRWADVTGSRWITRKQGKKRRSVRLLVIEGSGGEELLVAPHQVTDAGRVLEWAIAEAAAGRAEAIDERVQREGGEPKRKRVFVVHGTIGCILLVAIGALLFPSRLERHTGRELGAILRLPLEERIAKAGAIAENSWQSERVRCEASSMIVVSWINSSEPGVAATRCQEMVAAGCTNAPFDDCRMLDALVRAGAALTAGRPPEAADLGALEDCLFKTCINVRLRAMTAAGQEDQARELREECRRQFGTGVEMSDALAPCREPD